MFMEFILDFVVIKSCYREAFVCMRAICHKLAKLLCALNVLFVLHISVLVEYLGKLLNLNFSTDT